jgi:MoCo/4Fe-4S cofactor protein with predicted Tat translocation signal
MGKELHPETEPKVSKFWMSVDQAADPVTYAKSLPGEFTSSPIRDGMDKEGLDRRDFMKIMGASAMMASLAGCTRRPVQKIVPYVNNPVEIIPGQPNYYASVDGQTGYGLILTCREGRPIKVDGMAEHPLNKGAISARAQASVHDLYDPDRLRAPRISGAEVSVVDFDAAVSKALADSKGSVYLLTGTSVSPTLKRVAGRLGIEHMMVDALSMDDVLDGQEASYGGRVFPRYRMESADCIVSFGADFLGNWGSVESYTKDFSKNRKLEVKSSDGEAKKLVVFESAMTLTGQNADQRVAVRPRFQLAVALAVAHEVAKSLGRNASGLGSFSASVVGAGAGVSSEVISSVARELVRAKGRSLVLGAGSEELQIVVSYLNSILGNEGRTIDGSEDALQQFQGSRKNLDKLASLVDSGRVKALVVQGLNPAYLFGARWKSLAEKIPNLVYFTSHLDETAEGAKFVAAESHAFESWGDVSITRSLYAVAQPTIRPLWQTKSLLDSLIDWSPALLGSKVAENAHGAIQETARAWASPGKDFQVWFDELLFKGFVSRKDDWAAPVSPRTFREAALGSAISSGAQAMASAKALESGGGVSVVLTVSAAMSDGSQANNALLQELPDPVSKNTWGNYFAASPDLAKENRWTDGDIIKVEAEGVVVELPVYRQPGTAPGVLSAHLGYGRRFNGRIGNGVGVSLASWALAAASGFSARAFVADASTSKTGKKEKIPCTQGHHQLEGRDLVFDTSFEEYKKDPKSGIVRHFANPPSIWSAFEYKGYKWGMVIDLSSCTGCSACVVACSVENNVPSVGKDQVQKNREMQWIRIDRYYSEDPANPETLFQPMLCQHCDNAPCETVCPVLATVHSDEGLNQMIYNRCVGTKYCSNNCPYKVRRFNWFENNAAMNAPMEHPVALGKNPEVTLRSRGVMEKCTFCTQRIELGKHAAKAQGRRATDKDIRTACQEACPADAIYFGDVNNPDSEVSRWLNSPRGFTTLEELNTKANVTYLSKVRFRAPKPGKKKGHGGGSHEGEKAGHEGDHHG